MGAIHELLPAAAAKIGPVGKDRKNEQQKYKFRGIEDVLNAVNPVFSELGITAIPIVKGMERSERKSSTGGTLTTTILTVDYAFIAKDGSTVTASVVGEGMDSGDKSANKAMSAAYKYALGQVLCIPFDAKDSEDDNPQPAAKSHEGNGKANGKEEDKPANGKPQQPKITTKQAEEIERLANSKISAKTGKIVGLKPLLERLNLKSLADMTLGNYGVAKTGLMKLEDAPEGETANEDELEV